MHWNYKYSAQYGQLSFHHPVDCVVKNAYHSEGLSLAEIAANLRLESQHAAAILYNDPCGLYHCHLTVTHKLENTSRTK